MDDTLSDYDFPLPADRIAQEPAAERGAARLLVLPRREGVVRHERFADLGGHLRPGDLLVVNDTRVLPARIVLRRATGGRVDGLLLEPPRADRFRVMLQGKGRLRAGDELRTVNGTGVRLASHEGGGIWIAQGDAAARRDLAASGRMPLPPYIARGPDLDPRDALDRERYQSVFAREDGAVAAPTAGLHFDPDHLTAIEAAGVTIARITLHVGLGTFLPVRTERLADHVMHSESFTVPADTVTAIRQLREARDARPQHSSGPTKGRVFAVGTTVVRALETWARRGDPDRLSGETDLFIRPPFEFRVVDGMITNFHLPKSTLLVLVAAFAGRERVLEAYREAVAHSYRFFSYGDAMLIE